MIFFPNAKINIGLDILRRRTDGFHDIETVMVPVYGLYDVLEIVPWAKPGVVFSQTGLEIECPEEDNLIVKAYRLMEQRYGIGGARIHLHKIIPSGAGLGGGSSDAAFTIKGLDKIFSLELNTTQMECLAAELGSDTPFFINNDPQIAQGRGEILSAVDISINGKRLVIVKPTVSVSTIDAYAGVHPQIPSESLVKHISQDMATWKDSITNAFEKHIFAAYPILSHLKKELYKAGAVYASMSGSGAALYAVFDEKPGVSDDTENHEYHTFFDNLRSNYGELFVYQQIIP